MKALLLFALIVLMLVGLYRQSQQKEALQSQLDAAHQQLTAAQGEAAQLKQQIAQMAQAQRPPGSPAPVAGPAAAPAASARPPSSQWMWEKKSSPLDAPAGGSGQHGKH